MNELSIPAADYWVSLRGPFGTPTLTPIRSERVLRRTPDGQWAVCALNARVLRAGYGSGMPMLATEAARRFPQHAETILIRDRSR